ncbi:MAG: aminotransferase class V-fold PLP-dependent enzyme [Gammaproteobacteria bacterium]|nr:aminotransferase class V-fold PLP-dependent enzyme [Gammaproteobacteria bacterium]NIR84807.1 aminotransferase class V-fold PLP-dependent enzyme [Gammaproteobacteria bacterium]NIR91521.1 aminotransferase class V-fold PLP-dependent enzyme [Gammaproteobacteria bacterium]NIU05854.1 aminotransferase class V-fold PLP-dependent enzyme [Gammaproteobacteria bacterium]NIV76709.1 aminotransferase class V-fold PLP-dependent enzyme [Gammaproteobacteria bacterium]
MIPCQRHLFDIPEEVAYFNCAYLSPFLHSVREAGEGGIALEGHPWNLYPEHFFTESEEARALFGALLGASADDVAVIPAVSYGIAVAAANLAVTRGQRIVVLAEQFPSNVYAWRMLAAERGAEVVTVGRPADGDWTAAVLESLDERTAVAALPNCHWTDGGLLDLVRVGARCRELGAALVVDLTQSLGALPFDVSAVRPDFAVCAAYKWLLGPYSLGFMYVAPHRQDGRPLEHSWIARGGSENFAGLVNYRDDFQPGARRFDVGERSNFTLMPMAVAALRQLRGWGVPEIARTLGALTARIAEGARALGLTAGPEHLRAPHFLGLGFPGGPPAALPERLARERVYVSVRGSSMRATPHLWISDRDVERFLGVLAALR